MNARERKDVEERVERDNPQLVQAGFQCQEILPGGHQTLGGEFGKKCLQLSGLWGAGCQSVDMSQILVHRPKMGYGHAKVVRRGELPQLGPGDSI